MCFRSGENQVTMHKCFLLLVFMVIILPSLGLSRYIYSSFIQSKIMYYNTVIWQLFVWLFVFFMYFMLFVVWTCSSPGSLMSIFWMRRMSNFSKIVLFFPEIINQEYWSFYKHTHTSLFFQCRCVFLPDNGAFFVNYVITSSLMGTSMELLRIPALTVYALRLCFARSQAERIHVKRVSEAFHAYCQCFHAGFEM